MFRSVLVAGFLLTPKDHSSANLDDDEIAQRGQGRQRPLRAAMCRSLGCGELVEVKGWESRRLTGCGPLIKRSYRYEPESISKRALICPSPLTRLFP